MTQEQKNLLLKDLCGRLPYGVKISVNDKVEILQGIDMLDNIVEYSSFLSSDIEEVKPYLLPLSSMTEEQKDEIRNRFCYEWETDEDVSDLWKHELEFGYALEFIQWCYENHLDIGGLIPKDLAVDATNLNIYDTRI